MDLTHKTILRLTSFVDLYLLAFFRNAGYERHVGAVSGTQCAGSIVCYSIPLPIYAWT